MMPPGGGHGLGAQNVEFPWGRVDEGSYLPPSPTDPDVRN
jgi:hypothetical protein